MNQSSLRRLPNDSVSESLLFALGCVGKEVMFTSVRDRPRSLVYLVKPGFNLFGSLRELDVRSCFGKR